MPVSIQKTSQLALIHGVKILIYGGPGVGKTTLAASCGDPPGEGVLILSAENGLLSLRGSDIDCIQIKTILDFEEAYLYVMSPECKHHIIYIDSISEIAEMILSSAKAGLKDPRAAYGALIEQFTVLIKNFRDVSMKHVVMVAKEETYAPDGALATIRPFLPGSKLPVDLPHLVDEVFHMEVQHDGTRTFKTQPDGTSKAKDRSGNLLPLESADQGLQAIINKILA